MHEFVVWKFVSWKFSIRAKFVVGRLIIVKSTEKCILRLIKVTRTKSGCDPFAETVAHAKVRSR